MYRPQPKPNKISTQIYLRKLKDLDIDALQQDISTDFKENSLHQEGVISEIPKAR